MSLDPRRLQQEVDLPQTRDCDTLTNFRFMFLTPLSTLNKILVTCLSVSATVSYISYLQ